MTELPLGWSEVSIEKVALVNPPRGADLPADTPVSFVPMAAVEAETGQVDTSEARPFGQLKSKSYRSFEEGDILFAKITPCMENGKVTRARKLHAGRGFGSTEFHVLRAAPGINPDYLLHFVLNKQFRRDAARNMKGTAGQLRVPTDYLKEHCIPVPPTAEQERIVAAIKEQFSRLDAGVAALERVRLNLKRMRAAVLQAACTGNLASHCDMDSGSLVTQIVAERRAIWEQHSTKPYKEPVAADSFPLSVPDHWRIASLEALTDPVRVICYGILMPKQHIEEGIPYVRVKDMKGWTIDVPGLNRTSKEIASQYARASLRSGDLLLAIRGSYGRVAIIPPELDGANITQDSARIASHPALDHRYLLYYLGGSVANRYYQRVARGVAVKGVNIGDLRRVPVPVPPPDEQLAVADEVERQFSLLNEAEAAVVAQLRHSSSLRSSILAAAFSGRLVPQDPKDDPASVLLERIAAERASSNGNRPTRARSPRKKITA